VGVPCLTIRDNTDRPVTCTLGTNRLIGTDPDAMGPAVSVPGRRRTDPADVPFWDGHAGERVANVLVKDKLAAV
jgi:UDP-N-acetylglucosamine 2-epimerase (non-hydrolysing)